MSSTAKQLGHLWAVEQTQQSLECAAIVRSDGKSASIKSISECIQSSNASSFSICFVSLFSRSFSLFGLRPTSSTAARSASLWRDRAAS